MRRDRESLAGVGRKCCGRCRGGGMGGGRSGGPRMCRAADCATCGVRGGGAASDAQRADARTRLRWRGSTTGMLARVGCGASGAGWTAGCGSRAQVGTLHRGCAPNWAWLRGWGAADDVMRIGGCATNRRCASERDDACPTAGPALTTTPAKTSPSGPGRRSGCCRCGSRRRKTRARYRAGKLAGARARQTGETAARGGL